MRTSFGNGTIGAVEQEVVEGGKWWGKVEGLEVQGWGSWRVDRGGSSEAIGGVQLEKGIRVRMRRRRVACGEIARILENAICGGPRYWG